MKQRLLFLLFLLPLSASGATGRYYSTQEGLSSSLVNHILQDSRGFVWTATEWGLNRFDGTKFTTYFHIPNQANSLNDNYVRTLYETPQGDLLVGTIMGLMRYDRAADAFQPIPLYWGGKEEVVTHVVAMTALENGDVWIATSGMGVFILSPGDNEGHHLTALTGALSSPYLNSILRDKSGYIWIGTESSGLNRYNPRTGHVTRFHGREGLSGDNISAIAQDREGRLFVSTLTRGLNLYNPDTERFTAIASSTGTPLLIFSLCVDAAGRLLIGTDGQGVKIYDPQRGMIDQWQIGSMPFDIGRGKIHAILEDRAGDIWLGIFQKGVAWVPQAESRFDYWGYKSVSHNIIGSSSVTSICRDRRGTLWVGTDSDGLYGLRENGDEVVRTAHFTRTASPNSVPDIIQCIFEDSRGQLWLSSYTSGLARFDPATGRCDYIPRLADQKIYFITEDHDRNLLIGTFGSGLYALNLLTGAIIHHESSKREPLDPLWDELTNDWINAILCDDSQRVWIGHYRGLSCFDPATGSFTNYLGSNNILPSRVVTTLCQDRLGRIWAGTTTGLSCFDPSNRQITHFTTADGLPSDMICGIAQSEDALWISTYAGLSRMSIADQKFRNYYAGDGLQGNEFTRGAVYGDADGTIYFGGPNGITRFHPRQVVDRAGELNIFLTGFYVGNQSVRPGDLSGGKPIVTAPVSDADEFFLAFRDNTFTIELSTLDFSHPERIAYQYRLEGTRGNDTWTTSYPGANRITYNNLAPGRYRFSVRAVDTQTQSDTRTLSIVIGYPWWRSTVAYILYGMLALLLASGVLFWIHSRVRYRRELLLQEHARQIGEARLQFFINISHEIRTPMTLIINPLEKLLGEHHDASTHAIYLMIYRNAQRILRLINQIMDVRKADKGQMVMRCRETDMVGFIEDVMLTFDYTARKKNITLHFDHPGIDKLKVWIDLNHFDKVLLNLFSNALKFTPDGGTIAVRLATGQNEERIPGGDYFQITLTDSGPGIPVQERERIFDRFYQVGDQQTTFGTGVGLHLARLLVELHRGIIYAVEREDGQSGAQFVVRMPMGYAHFAPEQLENPGEMAITTAPDRALLSREALFEEDAPAATSIKRKPRSKSSQRILVVDDEPEIRGYVRSELEGLWRIDEASNGREALQKLLQTPYALVVSDVMMPELDGLQLTRKIKQHPSLNHIPVVLLTAKALVEERLEGLETGADAYLPKPFNSDILVQTISNLIESRQKLRTKFSGGQEQGDRIAPIQLKSADEVLMKKVLAVIEKNLGNSELNVEMLAGEVGLSRVHLHRKLKELTNQSARDFIRGIRLHQAAELLKDPKLTISEVAYATGFVNLSHFSSSFKEFYGISPKEFTAKEGDHSM